MLMGTEVGGRSRATRPKSHFAQPDSATRARPQRTQKLSVNIQKGKAIRNDSLLLVDRHDR